MIRRRIALLAYFALIALLLIPALARAEEGLSVRPAPEARGELVALSDVFAGVPINSDIAVARAPAPGAAVTLDPDVLRTIATRQGLLWTNPDGLRRVVVRAPSQPVSAEAIAALVADAIAQSEHATYIVELTDARPLHASIDVALAPEVAAVSLDDYSDSFSAEVTLAPGLEPVRVTGSAELSIALPVLARAIGRDEIVAAEDITYVETPASRAPSDALTDAGDIVGLAARRSLRAGVALKPFDLERPTIIARGDIVVVRFTNGALELTARARALDDVAEGDQARFVNLQSNRVIEAVATAPGEAWLVALAPAVSVVGGSL